MTNYPNDNEFTNTGLFATFGVIRFIRTMSETHRITKAATTIGMGTFLSRILGFLRDMVIAHFFGAGMAADAFFVAFRIPNLWRRLVGEGSLTISFIPVYTEYLTQRSEEETREVTHIAFTIAGVCVIDPDDPRNSLLTDFDPDHRPGVYTNSREISTDRYTQPDHLSLSLFHGAFCPLHGNPELPSTFLCASDCSDLSQYIHHRLSLPFLSCLPKASDDVGHRRSCRRSDPVSFSNPVLNKKEN